MRPKVGLMLGGGGAKGSYQVGIIKALEEAKILEDIDIIAGTSIGAINALLLMSGNKSGEMDAIWQLATEDSPLKQGLTRLKTDKQGLYSLSVLENILKKHINPKNIRNSKMDTYAVTAKLKDDKHVISQIKLGNHEQKVFHLNSDPNPIDAVIASASIPFVFGSKTIGDETFVDGGLVNNNPVDILIEHGCDILLVVPLDNTFNPRIYQKDDVLMVNFLTEEAFSKNILHEMIEIMSFTESNLENKSALGYEVGKYMIQKLKDLGYYKKGLFNRHSSLKSTDQFTYLEVPFGVTFNSNNPDNKLNQKIVNFKEKILHKMDKERRT